MFRCNAKDDGMAAADTDADAAFVVAPSALPPFRRRTRLRLTLMRLKEFMFFSSFSSCFASSTALKHTYGSAPAAASMCCDIAMHWSMCV